MAKEVTDAQEILGHLDRNLKRFMVELYTRPFHKTTLSLKLGKNPGMTRLGPIKISAHGAPPVATQ